METFTIDVPMPSMGATANELTVISLKTHAGNHVTKGQKIAELESDKSVFEFESPCDGVVKAVLVLPGDVCQSNGPFLQIDTTDESLRHLTAKTGVPSGSTAPAAAKPAAALVWTPRAVKFAQEAGLDPLKIAGIEATGPGGRVSGDDVVKYLATHR